MRVVGVCLVLSVVLAACSGGSKRPPSIASLPGDDSGVDEMCIDDDGDGYGQHCSLGNDCDDTDPTVTDECRRCAGGTVQDCPCTPGTKTVSCTPPVKHVTGGVLVCREGNRYCRDGIWSECETIGQYVFVADP